MAGGGKGAGGQALSQLATQGRGAGGAPGGQAAFAAPYRQAMQQRMAQARPAMPQAQMRQPMPPRPNPAQMQQAYQQFAGAKPPMAGGKGGPGIPGAPGAPMMAGKGGPGGAPPGSPPGLGGLAGLWFNQQRPTPPPVNAPDPLAAANTPAAITNAFGSTTSGAAPVAPTEPAAPVPQEPLPTFAANSLYNGGIVSLANGGAVWEPASRGGVTLAPATTAPAPAPVTPAPAPVTPAATTPISWTPGAAAATGNTGSMFNNLSVGAIKTPEKYVAKPQQTIWQPPAKVEDTSTKNKGISKFDMFIGGMGAGGQKYLQQQYAKKGADYRPTDLQRMQMMNKGGQGWYASPRGGSK